jgi:hypothetical protein
MPKSTYLGYARRAPDAVFADTEPVSSHRAQEARNNLLHFTDQFSQVRINWVVADEGIAGTANSSRIWCAEYPHTWLSPDKPANVQVFLQGSGAEMRVRLVPAGPSIIGDLSTPSVFSEVIDLTGGPTVGNVTHQVTPENLRVFRLGMQSPVFVNGSDGNPRPVEMCMMRLEISALSDDATFAVYAVCLREFA